MNCTEEHINWRMCHWNKKKRRKRSRWFFSPHFFFAIARFFSHFFALFQLDDEMSAIKVEKWKVKMAARIGTRVRLFKALFSPSN